MTHDWPISTHGAYIHPPFPSSPSNKFQTPSSPPTKHPNMVFPNPNHPNKPTLHRQRQDPATPLNHLHALLYSCALLALFYHHFTCNSFVATSSSTPTTPISSTLLILSDAILAFMWVLTQSFRWALLRRQEFPDQLLDSVKYNDLPGLDVFICTADPWKEPPMTVVNTALSVMAYDYPSEKISVYVSDDGGSDLTLFALVEAAKFARYWLPFCKENGIVERAPEAYYASHKGGRSEKLKIMYHKMKEKVENAMEKGYVSNDQVINDEQFDVFNKWKCFTRHNHPSIIQVLVDSADDLDILGNAIPNLIYVSREKSPTSPHHFKAGALNSLLRVSNTMTNAPVILTLDCDMYSHDPQTPQRALCYILDSAMSPKLSFVQFPQRFQGLDRNDIYGGEIKRLFTIHSRGMDGNSGPNYVGTGCFFRRCSLYGPPSSSVSYFDSDSKDLSTPNGSLLRSEIVLKSAHEVAGCKFEVGTLWGDKIGFRYGSLVEDYFTGYRLQCEGWISVFCDPERPAFLGDAPKNLNDSLSQCKRWIVGLLEVAFSKYNPLIFGTRKASLLMGMNYSHYAFWGIWSIPLTVYALLPQLALLFDLPLFPKLSDPWFYLYAYLFLAAYCQDLVEFLMANGTIQTWWSDQRMWMIRSLTSFSFGSIQFAINQMGLSAPGFTLTNKATQDGQNEFYDNGVFDFGIESPFFIILGTAAIINVSSFVLGILNAARKVGDFDQMFVQLFLSAFATVNCWPIIEAMFLRRDGGKMPRKITLISTLLAGVICMLGYFGLAD